MSKKKKKSTQRVENRKPSHAAAKPDAAAGNTEEAKKARRNVARHSTIIFVFTAVALLLIFAGRWIYAITVGYYDTFVNHGAAVSSAAANMRGLELTDEEAEVQLVLEKQWDLYTSSRLCDQVDITARDGVNLHGYLYNEGSDTTVVYIPRFDQDGTSDFLPGAWLSGELGYNLLLIDPRTHGGSGGQVFSYGYYEQYDLACWLDWAEDTLGSQRFLLWGEGTGANTALFAEASGLLGERVALIVAESAYGSLHELASRNIFHWFTVPAFPFLTSIEFKLNHGDAGYQVSDTSLVKALEGSSCTSPVLFLTAQEDDYILPEWSEAAENAYPGEKAKISGGGTHGTVYAACREQIQEIIQTMLRKF